MKRDNKSTMDKETLHFWSKECFDHYKFRLDKFPEPIRHAGLEEYEVSHKLIIDSIVDYNPTSISFSITSDPSLHFYIKFPKNIALFVESYIDLEDGIDTYVQVRNHNKSIFERNNDLKQVLPLALKHLNPT